MRFGQEFSDVGHPAAHALDALAFNFGLLDAQALPHHAQVSIPEQGAVADHARSADVLGISADLAAIGQNVIAAGEFGWHAHGLQDIDYGLGKFAEVMEIAH